MEHYEKKISFFRREYTDHKKTQRMKQQELMDKIGINMQSLSRLNGVNYPTFDTLEKIMDVWE